MAVSPDGSTLAVRCDSERIYLWNLNALLPAAQQSEGPPHDWALAVVERIQPAVVIVRGTWQKPGDKEARTRSGLGVLVDPQGVVVMPRRLVEGAATIKVELRDGREFSPGAAFAESEAGWAAVKLESDKPLPHAAWGDSDKAAVGDMVLSLDLMSHAELSLERGIVSARPSAEGGDKLLFMDSARSCPSDRDLLFNRDGEVIGIWGQAGAAPSNRIKKIINERLKSR
jgi:S1-C subfamily serine protease